ncbi:MAG: hypothetical protein GC199_11375 [Alphaproteobacteria bacterium]|nr:hypothetical protein [Alphaproteobacteria bacterium]
MGINTTPSLKDAVMAGVHDPLIRVDGMVAPHEAAAESDPSVKTRIMASEGGRLVLPPGADLSNPSIDGRDIVFTQPDGSKIVIVDGVGSDATITANGEEVPLAQFAGGPASEQFIEPAAPPPGEVAEGQGVGGPLGEPEAFVEPSAAPPQLTNAGTGDNGPIGPRQGGGNFTPIEIDRLGDGDIAPTSLLDPTSRGFENPKTRELDPGLDDENPGNPDNPPPPPPPDEVKAVFCIKDCSCTDGEIVEGETANYRIELDTGGKGLAEGQTASVVVTMNFGDTGPADFSKRLYDAIKNAAENAGVIVEMISKDKVRLTFTSESDESFKFSMKAKDGDTIENDETFSISLSEPAGATVKCEAVQTTIHDNDQGSFSICGDVKICEGDVAKYTVNFKTGSDYGLPPGAKASVVLTHEFGETGPADYSKTLYDAIKTAAEAAGVTVEKISNQQVRLVFDENSDPSFSFNLKAKDGTSVEDDETFTLKLSDAGGRGEIDTSKDKVDTTIIDNDRPDGLFCLTGETTVKEGKSACYTVTLQDEGGKPCGCGSSKEQSVGLQFKFGDTCSADFKNTFLQAVTVAAALAHVSVEQVNPNLLKLTFTGESDHAFEFHLKTFDDKFVEGNEQFSIKLVSLEGAEGPIDESSKQVKTTIIDNDARVTCEPQHYDKKSLWDGKDQKDHDDHDKPKSDSKSDDHDKPKAYAQSNDHDSHHNPKSGGKSSDHDDGNEPKAKGKAGGEDGKGHEKSLNGKGGDFLDNDHKDWFGKGGPDDESDKSGKHGKGHFDGELLKQSGLSGSDLVTDKDGKDTLDLSHFSKGDGDHCPKSGYEGAKFAGGEQKQGGGNHDFGFGGFEAAIGGLHQVSNDHHAHNDTSATAVA